MALIKCPECNKEISDKVAACPNCGFPMEEINKPKFSLTGMNICPKCGTTEGKFFDWDNYVAGKCPSCNTEMIDCHTSTNEFSNMSIDEEWQWRQELYNKYVKNSQEFDETLFHETFQKKKAEYEKEKAKYNYRASMPTRPSEPKVTCPYCHSTNVRKIGIVSRSVSASIFGLGSKKIGKQWHCDHCGSDF